MRFVGSFFALAVILAGCAGDESARYARDGVEYGVTEGVFRGRWWSYYERGVSFSTGKFYDEAVADFEHALEGRSRDSWQARTYGLHFQEYFPNRELGVAYFYQGRLEEAQSKLEESLAMVDTGRGQYYLTQVKKAKIAAGMIEDGGSPEMGVNTGDRVLIAERDLPLLIEAEDDLGVEKVLLDGKVLPQRTSGTEQSYAQELTFMEGQHRVALDVQDLADNTVSQNIAVTVDLTGPNIGIFSPLVGEVTDSDSALLHVRVLDRNGIDRVLLDDVVIAEAKNNETNDLSLDTDLELKNQGENRFLLTAVDNAGNETRSVVRVFRGK